MGGLLCEVNWVSVLSEALGPQPSPEAKTMVVYLLYMMVFLAKEDHLLSKPVSDLCNRPCQLSCLDKKHVTYVTIDCQNILFGMEVGVSWGVDCVSCNLHQKS